MSILQRLRPDDPRAFDFWCGFLVGLCAGPLLVLIVPLIVRPLFGGVS